MTPEQKLSVLLAGLIIVFVVLIFLVYLVKGYGTALHKLQTAPDGKTNSAHFVSNPAKNVVEQGISPETVAAIAAAVYMTYGETAGAITEIRRSAVAPARSAWHMAGLLENTQPF